MKQTAVDYLFEKLWEMPKDKFVWKHYLDKAKEMEKEQIEENYDAGYNSGCSYMYDGKKEFKNKEQYYQETYEQ